MNKNIQIEAYNYELPDEKIAKYPLEKRDDSKLLLYKNSTVSHTQFHEITHHLPQGALLVFNNTRVIRARLFFFKETGARIEIFCLEPHTPADYERAFSCSSPCKWRCMVGNRKKWKANTIIYALYVHEGVVHQVEARYCGEQDGLSIIEFSWEQAIPFGEMLERLGKIPIPPYLNRESCELDNARYQNVYCKSEGSVAAPTAGLHFTPELIESLQHNGFIKEEVTLHVGAGTFLPVKVENAVDHTMHIEHFDITIDTLQQIANHDKPIIAVGTTSVRTLESVAVIGYRFLQGNQHPADHPIGQWEAYDIPTNLSGKSLLKGVIEYMQQHTLTKLCGSTQIMITPGYRFRVIEGIITNFHQPKSTLLLLISALVGDDWKMIYSYATNNDFRFLSYGDSSLLLPNSIQSNDTTIHP